MNIIKLLFFLSVGSFSHAQNDSTYYFFNHSSPLEELKSKIEKSSNQEHKSFYKLIYHSRLRNTDSMIVYIDSLNKLNSLDRFRKVRLKYLTGFYYKSIENISKNFDYNYEAYSESKKINDTLTILSTLSALSQIEKIEDTTVSGYNGKYLEELNLRAKEYNNNYFNITYLLLKGNSFIIKNENEKAKLIFSKLLNSKFNKSDSIFIPKAYNSLGVLYDTNLNKPDSAIYYFNKKISFLEDNPEYNSSAINSETNINLANLYRKIKEYQKSFDHYNLAASYQNYENELYNRVIIKSGLADLYYEQGKYELAFQELDNYITLSDSLNENTQRITLADLQTKYKTKEKENENLLLEAESKKNQNIAIGLAGSLALGSIIAFLLFKNTKRKQKLAEQEKELETQKLTTVLKEQELNAIDAMIEGQEKERQRIANDLHDDLGGLMATVKLHFNALKEKQSPELYTKTNQLIDEAYDKVRTVAHAKNSGVIAKQGLLKAIKEMANKVSVSNKIQIEVIDHGLENRLENSLELTIFRIVQELITNVIKHANATEVSIHITNHDDSLNIMVEDNGKGFNPSQVTKTNKGMGISSIDKRVEHLEGTMTIESEKHQGTTIIIDIPL